jgi:hypothetical protein
MQGPLKTLAKIAARSAGYNPDSSLASQGEGSLNIGSPAWQHPKFMALANAAYRILTAPPFPEELNQAALCERIDGVTRVTARPMAGSVARPVPVVTPVGPR